MENIKSAFLPFIISYFQKLGKDERLTNSQIQSKLLASFPGTNVTDIEIRGLINHIRNNNLVIGLLADKKGYFIASSKNEYEKYIQSLIGRANAIMQVATSLMFQKNMKYPNEYNNEKINKEAEGVRNTLINS